MGQAAVSQTAGGHGSSGHPTTGARLGPFLCWAVVFADIGTSVYYVPGILFGQVGNLAGFFVALTLLVFLLLTLKYAEATVRFPEGGGEVTVAGRGLNPWAGAIGGMFILIDYFLTAAISSLSGLHYLSVVLPSLAPYVLLVTVVVVVALGVLNWWGIQESAAVSAVIASIAFASDLVILVVVLLRVPAHEIALIFGDIFAGSNLTGATLLTGYAGAFLAFSGLESIAQLAPVMRVPRRKTVSAALGVVALTVGFTGPLLTMFATILLTDPQFQGTMVAPQFAAQPEPSQFISLLAGAYAGPVLAGATALAASALLIFASNTAIIGGYHVVLALARLGYFPRAVRRTNALRGTPHVAIGVMTLVPIVVLTLVRGNIDRLGELYGFGLLGAFSLMCIAMDVIRWRERRGEPYIGAEIDPELAVTTRLDGRDAAQRLNTPTVLPGAPGFHETPGALGPGHPEGSRGATAGSVSLLRTLGAPSVRVVRTANQLLVERWTGLAARWNALTEPAAAQVAGLQARLKPLTTPASAQWAALWPHLKFYLGLLTTALVVTAWLTNLLGKPMATLFGGGLTMLGLGVAVAHYRYQQVRHPVVFLDTPGRVSGARLVVLTSAQRESKAVIQAALTEEPAHPLVFLYLAAPSPLPPPRLFEIPDRFALDEDAQDMLSRAKRKALEANIPAKFLYVAGGPRQVFDITTRVLPSEIVAEAGTAKRITASGAAASAGELGVSPDYVRYHVRDGVRISSYMLPRFEHDEAADARRRSR